MKVLYQVGLDESTVCGQIARRYLGTIVAGGTGIDAAYAAKSTITSNLAANNAPAPGSTCAKAGRISIFTWFCGFAIYYLGIFDKSLWIFFS